MCGWSFNLMKSVGVHKKTWLKKSTPPLALSPMHSLELSSFYLMKWPSYMLQNMLYFWNMKTHTNFLFIHHFMFQENTNGKIWSILLSHFIKHNALISKECHKTHSMHWFWDSSKNLESWRVEVQTTRLKSPPPSHSTTSTSRLSFVRSLSHKLMARDYFNESKSKDK